MSETVAEVSQTVAEVSETVGTGLKSTKSDQKHVLECIYSLFIVKYPVLLPQTAQKVSKSLTVHAVTEKPLACLKK